MVSIGSIAMASLSSVRAMIVSVSFAAILVAAACSGSQTKTQEPLQKKAQEAPTVVEAKDKSVLPSRYAPLFEDGRLFTYQGSRELSYWDDLDPNADEHGMVVESKEWTFTCTVFQVRTFPSGFVSELDCSEDHDMFPRTYLATGEGLFEIASLPEQESELPTAASVRRKYC